MKLMSFQNLLVKGKLALQLCHINAIQLLLKMPPVSNTLKANLSVLTDMMKHQHERDGCYLEDGVEDYARNVSDVICYLG